MTRMMNIFKGTSAEAVMALFEYSKETFPEEIAALSNSFGSEAYRLWSLSLKDASLWGERAASTVNFEPAVPGSVVKVYADESHKNFLFMNMMEDGIKTWSIKNALLASKRAKTGAGGVKYMNIPFQFRTPGKKDKAGSGFAGVMTGDVQELIRQGKSVGPEHGHMAGLKKFGGKGQEQFLTFRTVSEKSQGWQYPAIPPTPVFEKVQKMVDGMIADMMGKYVQEKLKEIKAAGSKA